VERTGEVEGSEIGGPEDVPLPEATHRGTVRVEVPQPRIYYRLTAKGKRAKTVELSDPIMTIYNYPREQRSPKTHKYYRVRG
jgi:DNA-binding HxlR family transcriptional regulator